MKNEIKKAEIVNPADLYAHDLRFNHLIAPDGKTYLQLIYAFGDFDPPLFYEVLLPTSVVEHDENVVVPTPGISKKHD